MFVFFLGTILKKSVAKKNFMFYTDDVLNACVAQLARATDS